MLLYSKYIKKIMYTCLALSLLACAHLISVYFFAVHRFEISYDPQLAREAQSDIATYINNYPTRSFGFKQLEQSLQKNFECICSLQGKAQPDGLVLLDIQAIAPLYFLDNEHILTNNNRIIAARWYATEVQQKLPILHIPFQENQKQLAQSIFVYVSALRALNLPDMELLWKQPHDVHIHLHADNIKLRCDTNVAPDQKFFDRCIQIARKHAGSFLQSTKVLADMRFDNQIIISKIKKLGEPL